MTIREDEARAEKIIAEQGDNLTLDQVSAQRDLWIGAASRWEAQVTTLSSEREILREALEPILRYHETGGHEGDGSDEALAKARAALDTGVTGG